MPNPGFGVTVDVSELVVARLITRLIGVSHDAMRARVVRVPDVGVVAVRADVFLVFAVRDTVFWFFVRVTLVVVARAGVLDAARSVCVDWFDIEREAPLAQPIAMKQATKKNKIPFFLILIIKSLPKKLFSGQ